jgi:transposase
MQYNKQENEVMKYTEFNINRKLFGEKYLIYDWQETEESTQIYVKSQSRIGICPLCGQASEKYHATYKRNIQIIPINMKTTYAKLIAYKYDCCNEDCEQKVFMESLPFALRSQVRSTELNLLILAVSLFLSNEGTSNVLRLIGIRVSDDAIKRLYNSIDIADEPDIEAVGIDDVAIRKGQSYATAIYDMNDRHLISLLEGREASTLKEWLKNHRKINLVTRDRASGYASAISEVLPDCVQVADRFHLLANLIEKMRDIFREAIPAEILIKDGQVLDSPPEKVKNMKISPKSKELIKYDYDNTPPLDENGMPLAYDNKKRDLEGSQYKRHAESRKKNKN